MKRNRSILLIGLFSVNKLSVVSFGNLLIGVGVGIGIGVGKKSSIPIPIATPAPIEDKRVGTYEQWACTR